LNREASSQCEVRFALAPTAKLSAEPAALVLQHDIIGN